MKKGTKVQHGTKAGDSVVFRKWCRELRKLQRRDLPWEKNTHPELLAWRKEDLRSFHREGRTPLDVYYQWMHENNLN